MAGSPRDPSRIAGYLGSMTAFTGALAAAALVGRRNGRSLPASYAPLDLALGALATHKFTRILAKDGITTPLRAPFTEFEGEAGSAEVHDTPRDGHVTHVVGELITCPFCLAPWVASAYVAALALAPPQARAWAAVFSMVGAADFLQHAYGHVRED